MNNDKKLTELMYCAYAQGYQSCVYRFTGKMFSSRTWEILKEIVTTY